MVQKLITKKQNKKLHDIILEQMNGLIYKEVYSDDFNLKDEDRCDEVDAANAAVANSQQLRFRNRENFYAKKLRSALGRIEKGHYGKCEECDDPISFNRLVARPTAELCIICKEEAERDESVSFVGRKSKSLGRTMNAITSPR